jgi:hypothetical protein
VAVRLIPTTVGSLRAFFEAGRSSRAERDRFAGRALRAPTIPAGRWSNIAAGPLPDGLRSSATIAVLCFSAVSLIALVVATAVGLLSAAASRDGTTL